MADESKTIVPVWTLATGDVRVPDVSLDKPMSAERLASGAQSAWLALVGKLPAI